MITVEYQNYDGLIRLDSKNRNYNETIWIDLDEAELLIQRLKEILDERRPE
jgi:hypothetical protein